MSRRKLKARDKITRKMTKNGAVEHNAATGADICVSKREADFVLCGDKESEVSFSRTAKIPADKKSKKHLRNKNKYTFQPEKSGDIGSNGITAQTDSTVIDTTVQTEKFVNPKQILSGDPHKLSFDTSTLPSDIFKADTSQFQTPDSIVFADNPLSAEERQSIKSGSLMSESLKSNLRHDKHGRLKFSKDVSDSGIKDARKHKNRVQPQAETESGTGSNERIAAQTDSKYNPQKDVPGDSQSAVNTSEPEAVTETNSSRHINAEREIPLENDTSAGRNSPETAADAPKSANTRKLDKAQRQSDRAITELDKAKAKLPSKKKLRSKLVFDEQSGKSKRKLYFETEVKSQAEHLKGALPLRPFKAAGNTVIGYGHNKIYQTEKENTAVEAAHKGEIAAEGVARTAIRHHKLAPYAKVAKLERKSMKKSINLSYQKALAENPQLKSNIISRTYQKRKIKRDYAKAAREAKKNAERVKKAGSAVGKAGNAVAGAVKHHPVATAAVGIAALLMVSIMSLIGVFGGAGGGGAGGILAASYLAEDADIDNAELLYTELETDLQLQIANAETSHPGYDEYRYSVDNISHDPLALIAYLTAKYNGFKYADVQSELSALFGEQYTLIFTPVNELYYADPSDADKNGDYEPYSRNILNVTLKVKPFADVVIGRMNSDEISRYNILMQTKGNRQYAGNPLGFEWISLVTSGYGYRIHPVSGVKDYHKGVDIAVPSGTAVHSVQNGTIKTVGYDADNYGHFIVIEDTTGLVSKYAHLDEVLVSEGETVITGAVIAKSGNTGNSTGPHLHFEMLYNDQHMNPLIFSSAE
ncbi:peptidase M24 [Clostridia bacterium]|nr:peptidase M24 [Clostridia bacterium]